MKKALTWGRSVLTIAVVLLVALLLGAMLPFVPYQIRIVESGSMAPTIPMGSVIFLSQADSYTVGDVVTYQRIEDEEVTTHRIVAESMVEGNEVFTLQGDANDVADSEPVEAREVSGKVWGHVPYLGFMLDFFRQPIGFLLLVVIPAILVIHEQINKIRREMRKQHEK